MAACCGAAGPGAIVGHQEPPSGWRRSSGWPGETRSPSSTSHSTILPPCGGGDAGAVAQAGDLADRAPAASTSSAAAVGREWKVPLAGRRASARSAWCRCRDASPCLSQNARASSSWSGVLSANVSTPLQGALGDAGEGAGRRHLEDAGDAEVAPSSPCRGPSGPGWRSGRRSGRAPRGRRGRPGRRGWRSRGCAGRGSTRSGRASARWPTAGAMCSVWKAPATLSGISRALAGGSAANASSCSSGAGGDDLAGAVVVGRGEAVLRRARRGPRRGRRRGRRSCRSA